MSTMKPGSQERFVDAWGAMGALWGINRSVARVHALLMASELPVPLDEIAERLSISKGNASMSLRELRGWGVIRPVPVAGDRRDFYATEPDVWTMFFRILQERKRREFDPALRTVQALLEEAGGAGDVRTRLEQMTELLTTVDGLMGRFLKDAATSRMALSVLAGLALPGLGRKKRKRT
jgi:DNA-binding transcriptional regulator GbsR (MarR family)